MDGNSAARTRCLVPGRGPATRPYACSFAVAIREKAIREEAARNKAEHDAREVAWKAREESAKAERDRLAKLDAARGRKSPLGVLRAAGYSDEEIMGPNSTLPVDLLNEMQQEGENKPAAVPGLTEERARALIAEQRRLDAEEAEIGRAHV